MKKFGKMAGKALIFCAVMMLLCSFAYPLALTGAGNERKGKWKLD